MPCYILCYAVTAAYAAMLLSDISLYSTAQQHTKYRVDIENTVIGQYHSKRNTSQHVKYVTAGIIITGRSPNTVRASLHVNAYRDRCHVVAFPYHYYATPLLQLAIAMLLLLSRCCFR